MWGTENAHFTGQFHCATVRLGTAAPHREAQLLRDACVPKAPLWERVEWRFMRLHERGDPQFGVWNRGVGLLPSATRFKVTAMNLSPLANLTSRFGGIWAAIGNAVTFSENQRKMLRDLICGNGDELRPDANFVVFGSLARGESTAGSDVDWSLLIDGQTDPADMEAALRIEKLLRDGGWKHPGPSGIFGSLAFSHSLVHDIGGGADNYVNTTRRMLLLLVSPIARDSRDRKSTRLNSSHG